MVWLKEGNINFSESKCVIGRFYPLNFGNQKKENWNATKGNAKCIDWNKICCPSYITSAGTLKHTRTGGQLYTYTEKA